jgi:hypothetical protein
MKGARVVAQSSELLSGQAFNRANLPALLASGHEKAPKRTAKYPIAHAGQNTWPRPISTSSTTAAPCSMTATVRYHASGCACGLQESVVIWIIASALICTQLLDAVKA